MRVSLNKLRVTPLSQGHPALIGAGIQNGNQSQRRVGPPWIEKSLHIWEKGLLALCWKDCSQNSPFKGSRLHLGSGDDLSTPLYALHANCGQIFVPIYQRGSA
jgi:hypothetical protein